jgi:tetratricopeptide (TPR) repeat protein
MRQLLLVFSAFSFALLLAFGRASDSKKYYHKHAGNPVIIRCSPDWTNINEWLDETDMPIIPGAGSYHWKINTASDSAQVYFDQGINCYYSFHIIEAMGSFKKAARFDPNCAMLYWAQALAYGPNINDFGYAASPEALEATAKARSFSSTATPLEKELISAISVRYTADSSDVNRKQLNERYTAAMKEVYAHFNANADAGTLYADAMMLEHPWDLWFNDGRPKEWTPAIRQVLEDVLARSPLNPGANHYYIHVMEPSPFPEKALAAADRLGRLTPGLSHTVHMPSHIYLRTGAYGKGVTVNEAAVNRYKKVLQLYSPVSSNDFLYIIHNLHMQTNNAMLAGMSAYSALSARQTVASIPKDYFQFPGPLGNMVQYIYMVPTLVDIRFGNWDRLINATAPPENMIYGNILYHFGKGMALAQRSRVNEAKVELSKLQELMKDSSLLAALSPFSAAIDGCVIAENLLIGSIALKEKKNSDAIAAFEEAVVTEEGMVYDEPRDWLLNPKHYLANAYLVAGRPQAAREILEKDLQNNRENGWALFGVWQALVKEKKNAEASRVLARFRKAFAKADIKLYGPVF